VDLYQPMPPSGGGKDKTPSFLRRSWRGTRFLAGGPIASLGVGEISKGARLIERLFGVVRNGPPADPRLKTTENGQIDLVATALSYGITVEDLTQRLGARQSQTALAAYVLFGLGVALLPLWLYAALHVAMSRARMVAAIEYLPFCAVFFLLAFKSAWMNWQLRIRRLGSAVAYLRTTDPFLPH
jgi:hypothetical protein